MAKPYSLDLRTKIVIAYKNEEGSQTEIAERFNVGLSTVGRYWREYCRTGKIYITVHRHGPLPELSDDKLKRVRQLVLEHPDATLDELCKYYNKNRKIKVGRSMMWRACKNLGFKVKKKSLYAQECDREDIKKRGKNTKRQ